MTRTATVPTILVDLHIIAMLALCAVAARMLITGAGITGQVRDLCSGIPFIAGLLAGWNPPDLPLPGLHENTANA